VRDNNDCNIIHYSKKTNFSIESLIYDLLRIAE